jgi:hypothetical protein
MQSVGLPWYTAETYPVIRDVMSDGEDFPASYSDWLSEAERERRRLECRHAIVYRIPVDPKAFAAWCRVNDLRPDAAARMLFAEKATRRMCRKSA